MPFVFGNESFFDSPLYVLLEKKTLPFRMDSIPISIHEVDKLWADRSYRINLVPAFYVMQQRELISDSVRRKFVLDCPLSEVMREY